MSSTEFSTDIWREATSLLPQRQAQIAVEVLLYSALELGARPYHRSSAHAGATDRQTIFKHPTTGSTFFVITVTRDRTSNQPFSLRLDFYDESEEVVVDIGEAHRAPNTQWTRKHERRVFVSEDATSGQLRAFVRAVCLAASGAE
jgi:hypothetical protein